MMLIAQIDQAHQELSNGVLIIKKGPVDPEIYWFKVFKYSSISASIFTSSNLIASNTTLPT
jgi:hypothetical protein